MAGVVSEPEIREVTPRKQSLTQSRKGSEHDKVVVSTFGPYGGVHL
jgi:hypothetical protein